MQTKWSIYVNVCWSRVWRGFYLPFGIVRSPSSSPICICPPLILHTYAIYLNLRAGKKMCFVFKQIQMKSAQNNKVVPCKSFHLAKKSDFWAKGKLCSGCAFCFLINLSRYWNLFVILLFCLVLFWYRDIERGMPDEILCCIHFWLNFQFAILPFPFCAISRRQIRDWEGAK